MTNPQSNEANSTCFKNNWNRTANKGECPKCYQGRRVQSNELREEVTKLVWGGRTDVDGILALIQERERLARIDEVKLLEKKLHYAKTFSELRHHKNYRLAQLQKDNKEIGA